MKTTKFLLSLLLFMALASAANAQESNCGNGIDDDGDGLIDCFDGDCANNSICVNYFIGTDKTCQIPPPKTSLFAMKLAASSANLTAYTLGVLVAGDLNRDGIPDVVTTHQATKRVYILKGTDLTVQKVINTQYEPEFFDHSIANINNDNCGEIFIAEFDGTDYYVSSYDCSGAFIWRSKAYGKPYDIGLADFDQDGKVELYYRNEILDAATGTIIVKGSGDWNTVDSGPVAVDVLAGNGLELVLGGEIFTVSLGGRSAGAGSITSAKRFNDLPGLGPVTYYPKFNGSYVTSQTSVADFNLDGKLDVVMNGATSSSSTATTTVFLWDVANNNFKLYQPKQLNGSSWYNGTGRVNLADIDGDGKMNATFVSGSRLFALNDDFSLKWAVTISELTSGFTSTTVFDFNNDGASEIVYRDEANLYIIDGTTGNAFATSVCKSRTANEYPIVVDVDADGATEICITCASNDGDDINNLSLAGFGQVRMFKSNLDPWVPARKVWNQHAYFNVNVNDDLTIPRTQQQHQLISSSGLCTPGKPLNTFLNQSGILDSKACPTYPSPDVRFKGALTYAVPVCPTTDFPVSFAVENNGDLILTGNLPITFYNGDPRKPGAQKLNTQNISLNQFKPDSLKLITNMIVKGTGGSFTLFASLNDSGNSLPSPITQPNTSIIECVYTNNFVSVDIVPTNFQIVTAFADQVKCGSAPAIPNGSANAFKQEGALQVTAGYTFYWFNGPTVGSTSTAAFKGAQWTGLAAGTYSVFSVNNATGCQSDPQVVTIGTKTKAFGATISVDNPYTSCSNPDGKLTVTPTGGAPVTDYNYEWYKGAVIGTSPILSKSNVLSSAQGSTYSVLVTDKLSNCNTILTATIPDQTVLPTVQVLNSNVKPALCNPANSGSASADVGGVTTGYVFKWYNGGSVKPSPDFVGPTYSGLLPGTYTVVANNATSGCVSNSFSVVVTSTSGITVSSNVTTKQFSCDPAAPNGEALATAVNVSGGPPVKGFSYAWYVGFNSVAVLVAGQTPGPGTPAQATIKGLAAGNYTVLATNNDTGCSNTSTVSMTDNKIPPSVSTSIVTQSTCNPANGSITATVTGGLSATNTYTYYWYNGNVGSPTLAKPPADFFEAPALTASSSYKALVAGQYTLVALDNTTKCASSRMLLTVNDATNTPTTARINTTIVNLTSCDPLKANGSVSANVLGVTAGYSFRWFTGSDTTSVTLPRPLATTAAITNLAAGSYTVKVTNKASTCEGTKVVSISNKAAAPTLALAKSDNSSCDPAVYLGTLKATFASNANDPTNKNTYVYRWTLGGAPYLDASGKSVTTNQLINLKGGTYGVTVEDKTLNCVSTPVSQAINNSPVPPTISVAQTGSTNCPGGVANGKVTLTVFSPNSEAPDQIEYQWYSGKTVDPANILTGETNRILDKQQGGPTNFFTVKVTSQISSCDNTATVLLQDVSAAPVLTLNTVTNTICTPLVGSLNYNGSVSRNKLTDANKVGSDTYTYKFYSGVGTGGTLLNTPGPTSTLPNLNGGTYTATVTNDRLNCVSNPVTVTVNNNLTLPDLSVTSTPTTVCPGTPANGAVQAVVNPISGGDSYAFLWNSGAIVEDPGSAGSITSAIIGQPTGSYTVKATRNSTGCVSTGTQTVVDNSALPLLSLTTNANTGCAISTYNGKVTGTNTDVNRKNGHLYTYTLTTTGATQTYTATAVAPNPPTTFGNLNAGTYTVTVKNNTLGCTSNPITATVVDGTVLPTISLTQTPSTNCVTSASVLDNGKITVNSPPAGQSYAWFTGTTAVPANQIAAQTASIITGLKGGAGKNFTVEVTTNATLCKNTSTLLLADNSAKPIITLTPKANTACSAPFNGDVAVTIATDVNKATAIPFDSYTYAFTPSGTGTVVGNKLTVLPAGSYTATATNDRLGCTSNAVTTTVVDNKVFPALTTTVANPQTSCDLTNPLGKLQVNITNKVTGPLAGPFVYNWYVGNGTGGTKVSATAATPATTDTTTPTAAPTSGLLSNTYTSEVIDTNTGCASTKSIFLPDKITLPSVSAVPTATTACFVANGSLQATVSIPSGSSNYTIYYLHEEEFPVNSGIYKKTTDQTIVKAIASGSKTTFSGTAAPPTTTDINAYSDYSSILNPKNLVPGNYSILVTDDVTKCDSPPITVTVVDNTNKAISAPGIVGASSCTASNGTLTITSISPQVNPNTSAFYQYSYQLYKGGPQNSNSTFSFMNNANRPKFLDGTNTAVEHGTPVIGGQNLGLASGNLPIPITDLHSTPLPPSTPLILTGLGVGLYTLVVTDETGCGKVENYTVPYLNAPLVNLTAQNSTKCKNADSDASIDLVVTSVNPFTDYTLTLYPSLATDINGNPTSAAIGTLPSGGGNYTTNNGTPTIFSNSTLPTPTFNTIGGLSTTLLPGNLWGDYIVQLTDITNPGSPCTLTAPISLKTLPAAPIITIDELLANTMCDPAFADGKVKFTVTRDPNELSVKEPTLLPALLAPAYELTSINTQPQPALAPLLSLGTTGTQTTLTGFKPSPQSYTITVTETNSGCVANQTFIVPNQPDIPGPITLTVTDESFCTPNSNGKVEVTAVSTNSINNYSFSYYSDAALTDLRYSANGGAATPGEVFNLANSPTGWKMGLTGAGNTQTYYVKATKLAGAGITGIGCVAPVETAVVKDTHTAPTLTLSSLPDTSCDITSPEGSFTLAAATNTGTTLPTVDPIRDATYTYSFNTGLGGVTGQVGSSTYNYPFNVVSNDYTATVTNEVSGCVSSADITVGNSKYPVAITTATSLPQLICNPDGSIVVNEVTLDKSAKGLGTASFTSALTTDFDFNWFKTTAAPFGDALALPDPLTVPDNTILETLSTANYPAMGFGEYYVLAKKKTTEGRGCVSPPFLVKVNDASQNPSVLITPFPNTSCEPTIGEGELKIKVTDPLALSTDYTYTWSPVVSSNVSAVSPANSVFNNGNQLADGDNDYVVGLLEGAYTVKVTSNQTNCFSNTTATLNLSKYPVSIVSANSVNQLICNPDGSIQLKEVKLDRRAKALDSVRYLTSAQITTNFDFNWFNTTPPTVTTANFGTVGSPLKDVGLAMITSDVLSKSNFVTMKAGTYYAVAKKKTGEGLGCVSPPIEVKIQDKSIKPQLTFETVSNSACSPAFFDGQLTFAASDSTAAASAPKPYEYSYTWLSNPTDGILTPPSNNFGAVTAINEASTTRTKYKEGQYKIRLKNETTGCVLDSARTTILKNEVPVFVKSVKTIDQLYCSQLTGGVYVPVKSGNSVVTSVTYTDRAGATIIPTTPQLTSEFTYQWTDSLNNVLASNFRLDSLSANGKGRYFVTVTRNNSLLPGSGCSSAPFRVNIQDNRQFPTVSFSTLPQTICDNRFEIFDGKITAKPATSNIKYLVYDSIKSKTLGSPVYDTLTTKYFAAQNPTYDFDWTNLSQPVGAVFSPLIKTNLAVYNSATQGDIISTGTYSVLVTNRLNGCTAKQASTVFVDKITPDIAVLDVDVKHQFDCTPFDGSLAINGRDAKYVSLPAIAGETYSFDWYAGDYDRTKTPFEPTPPRLASVDSDNATPVAVLSSANYPSMAAGKYHVVATKKGGSGSGCVSIPYPVILRDSTQNPAIDTKSIANYACIATLGNGSISATVNDGTKGGEAINDPTKFTFQWSFDKAGTSPIPPSKNGNSPTATGLPDGTYFVTATDQASPYKGCVNTVSGSIGFQPTVFTATLTSTPQVNCPPAQDGSLTVVEITETVQGFVNSTYNITKAADKARFDFQWFDVKNTTLTPVVNGAAGGNVLLNQLAGQYYTTFTNPLGCTSTANGGIILDKTSKPVISLDNFTNPTICLLPAKSGGFQVSADQNLNFSDYTFQWLQGPTISDPEYLADSPDVSGIFYNDPLTYTVKVTNKATRCFSNETYTFAVDTIAIRALASTVPLSNCRADNGVLFGATADGIGNLYRFDWYNGASATGTPVYADQKEILTAPIGTFTVKASIPGPLPGRAPDPALAFCPSIPATVKVEDGRVYPPPTIQQKAPLTYCDPAKANGVAKVTVNGSVTGYTFDWYEGPITTPSIYTGSEVQGLKAVLYTAKATDDASGCFGTKTITIEDKQNVIPAPIVIVLNNRTNCLVPDGELTATVNGEVKGYTFRWYNGTAATTLAYDKSEFYKDLDVGSYTTVAVEDISGCVSKPTVTAIKPFEVLPDFDIVTKPTNCEAKIGEAVYVPLNDVLLSSITWDIEGVTQVGSILSGLPKGVFTVTATSDKSCITTKSLEIRPEILVFNGISSNNDNANEVFEIACITDFPNNVVKIFNRQGTIVYQAKGYNNADVAFKGVSNQGVSLLGTELPEGTYFYIIDKADGSAPRSGYLELLR